MLFTHFGVSGPVILSASSVAGDCLTEAALAKQPVRLTIDLKPALSEEQLEGRLLREIDAGRNKAMKHILEKLLPKSLVPVILKLSGIPPEKKRKYLDKRGAKGALCTLKKTSAPGGRIAWLCRGCDYKRRGIRKGDPA